MTRTKLNRINFLQAVGLAASLALAVLFSLFAFAPNRIESPILSSKRPTEVANCIGKGNGGSTTAYLGESRFVVLRNGRNRLLASFAIYPVGNGSRIEISHPILAMIFVNWKRCIR